MIIRKVITHHFNTPTIVDSQSTAGHLYHIKTCIIIEVIEATTATNEPTCRHSFIVAKWEMMLPKNTANSRKTDIPAKLSIVRFNSLFLLFTKAIFIIIILFFTLNAHARMPFVYYY